MRRIYRRLNAIEEHLGTVAGVNKVLATHSVRLVREREADLRNREKLEAQLREANRYMASATLGEQQRRAMYWDPLPHG